MLHLQADRNGKGLGLRRDDFLIQLVREVHLALLNHSLRDQLTLLVSGGIAMAEHVAKILPCGADGVVIDTVGGDTMERGGGVRGRGARARPASPVAVRGAPRSCVARHERTRRRSSGPARHGADGSVDRGSVGGGGAWWQYTLAGHGAAMRDVAKAPVGRSPDVLLMRGRIETAFNPEVIARKFLLQQLVRPLCRTGFRIVVEALESVGKRRVTAVVHKTGDQECVRDPVFLEQFANCGVWRILLQMG